VSLPAATDIGIYAFAGCTGLTSLILTSLPLPAAPAAPPALGTSVFYNTGINSKPLYIYVDSGKISAYTDKWDVDAITDADKRRSKYGNNHKAITITDTDQPASSG
jgi:hypothetical protein